MPAHAPPSSTSHAHVVLASDAGGKKATIAGDRIRVRDVVLARDLGGLTPEETVATVYPSLTLGEVCSALAYDEDHREEIRL